MDRARITVRMPQDLKSDVERLAERDALSMNAVIILALRQYVAKCDKKKARRDDDGD